MTAQLNYLSYPKPDFVREDQKWFSLDGQWKFAYDDEDVGLREKWYSPGVRIPSNRARKIIVPFVHQTAASGIYEQEAHQVVWYQRQLPEKKTLTISDDEQGRRYLLRFGAVDYEATVWIDGHLVGRHSGGHVPFEFDVTDYMTNVEGLIIVRVFDATTDLTQPRGKQYWGPKPEGIFYTPSTGIWQSVWLESVPPMRIADSSHGTVLRSNDIESGEVDAEIAIIGRRKAEDASITVTATLEGINIATTDIIEVDKEKDIARFKIPLRLDDDQIKQLPQSFLSAHSPSDPRIWHNSNLALWSPEHPLLYTLIITLRDADNTHIDTIQTYTGMRSLSWIHPDNTLRLNSHPYFHALVLDQGYWPRTNMTPPTPTSTKQDILLAKAMGFNGCRKHQKLEDPSFLYWADKLGFLVWSEMPNAYEFSPQYIDRFDQEYQEAIKRDINHPCIVAWTPVNETWGYGDLAGDKRQQNHIRSLYYMTKVLDATRPVNDNCGWEHVCTDLLTFHDYSDGPRLAEVCSSMPGILEKKGGREMFVGGSSYTHLKKAPVLCTEFGGVNIALKPGERGEDGEWGYTTASDAGDLLERVRKLMLGVVQGGHCCGFVYTQLTDIEQETNGLYTFDRREKLPAAEVRGIIEECKRVYFERLEGKSGNI